MNSYKILHRHETNADLDRSGPLPGHYHALPNLLARGGPSGKLARQVVGSGAAVKLSTVERPPPSLPALQTAAARQQLLDLGIARGCHSVTSSEMGNTRTEESRHEERARVDGLLRDGDVALGDGGLDVAVAAHAKCLCGACSRRGSFHRPVGAPIKPVIPCRDKLIGCQTAAPCLGTLPPPYIFASMPHE